jgi:hypothetical protein
MIFTLFDKQINFVNIYIYILSIYDVLLFKIKIGVNEENFLDRNEAQAQNHLNYRSPMKIAQNFDQNVSFGCLL